MRSWIMGLVTMILIPVLILGGLEAGLRVTGFGYSTKFFEKGTVDGETYLFTNHRFTFRFFPQALARSMIPHRILAEKPGDTYRIFIFGESAANGDPDPAYGFGRNLEILLEERFPGTDFEVVNTAITAINSHVILPIARECAKVEGDLWILYMGNNEIIGPYGPGTIFGSKAPPVAAVRASLAVKRTRIAQLIDTVLQNLRPDSEMPETWGGINMFSENLLREDDPARRQALASFRVNLEDILKAGQSAGVPILLSTVAVNLRDCAPFSSLSDPDLTEGEASAWASAFEEGKRLEEAGSPAKALEPYARAATIDPGHAGVYFRMGRCYGLTGNLEAARNAFARARDTDALAVRADSQINAIIREGAGRPDQPSLLLVDSEKSLGKESPAGIPGRELFYEHVHYTVPGNYLLARLFADPIVDLLPDRISEADRGSWVPPVTCQRKLAVSLWDRARLWTDLAERLSTPPFTARSNNDAELAYATASAEQARTRINDRIDRKIYELAIEEDPGDFFLRRRFGHYLMRNKDLDGAIAQFRWITTTFPDFEGGHQDLGLALLLAKRYPEAEKAFERVLEIRPGYARALKALELMRTGPPDSP